MAPFNPGVQPTQDQNYLNYAKVTEAPSPNQSTAIGIETASRSLEGAVQVTDTAIKKGIETAAYKKIDPERDQMTSALEAVKAGLPQGNQVPAPVQTVAGTTTSNPLDANASADEPSVPDGVDQGLEQLTRLKEAQKAAKINDTQYSMQTLSIAKQLRAQYPGYRDYVDEQVSKISGLPVANAYYKNLMEDINRQLVQTAQSKDKVEALYLKNLDVPNIQASWASYKTGKMSEAEFIGTIADYQNLQSGFKIDAAARADKTANKADLVDDQTSRWTRGASNQVNNALKNFSAIPGMNNGQQLVQYFDDVAAGKYKQTAAQIDQRATQLSGYIDTQYRALKKQAQTPGPDGSTVESTIGVDASEKIIQNALLPLQNTLKMATDKNSGPAFFAARQNTAIAEGDKYSFLTSKDTGPASRQLMTARGVLGEQYFPDFVRSFLENDVDSKFKNLLSQEGLAAVAPMYDERGQPLPQRNMKMAIQHGKQVNVPDNSGYYGSITNLVTKIADPNMPQAGKDALINWAYKPENVGRLNELKTDYRDPNTGEMVPGKFRAFNIMYSKGITDSVAENSKVKPENYAMYKSTGEQEFGALYRADVQTLNKIIQKPYLNAHFSWNDDTGEIGLVDNKNRPIVYNERAQGAIQPDKVYLNGMLDVLTRVNNGLKKLEYVQQKDPSGNKADIASYAFKTLKDMHFDPRGEKNIDITGAPAQIQKSIYMSRNPETTPEDLDKMILKQNFSAEDDRSLAAFIRSPAGQAQGQEPQQTRGVIRGNLSDEKLMGIQTDEIPEGMSAREFIGHLKAGRRFESDVK